MDDQTGCMSMNEQILMTCLVPRELDVLIDNILAGVMDFIYMFSTKFSIRRKEPAQQDGNGQEINQGCSA
jgi:hypothetical protein